jgi:DNA-binding CsgD family transcriptional regulator
MRGESFLYAGVAGTLVRDFLDRMRRGERIPKAVLTAREEEVVKLIAEGHSSKEIAATLVISYKTVERHRSNVLAKPLGDQFHDFVVPAREHVCGKCFTSTVPVEVAARKRSKNAGIEKGLASHRCMPANRMRMSGLTVLPCPAAHQAAPLCRPVSPRQR